MRVYLAVLLYLMATGCAAAIEQSKRLDDGGSGPFKAIATSDSAFADFVVYRPEDIAAAVQAEGALAVVIFANGSCMDTSLPYERMLTEIASNGYLVIALGAMQTRSDDRELNKAANAMMSQAIDLLTEQSLVKGSDFYRAVNLERIALAGHSCGGAQLLAMADDPRARTYLMFNSGIGDMTMAQASRQQLANLHGPTVYLVGGDSDVATANAQLDYQRINHVPVALGNALEGGHSGTYDQANGGSFAQMALRWLDWQLKNQQSHANVFLQADLTEFPGWTMKAKQFTP